MPRANSRKRNTRRNANAMRLPAVSNLSPNAPEFVPLNQINTGIPYYTNIFVINMIVKQLLHIIQF